MPESDRWVRRVFFDLIGRPPTRKERADAAKLDARGIVSRLIASADCADNFFLDRLFDYGLVPPNAPQTSDDDYARLQSIPQRLASGAITQPDAIGEILLSRAYDRRNMNADNFVRACFEQALGRIPPDDELNAGKAMYAGRAATLLGKTGKSRADVVGIITRDFGFYEYAVRVLMLRYILFDLTYPSRTATVIDLDRAARQYAADATAIAQIHADIVLSQEYRDRVDAEKCKTAPQWVASVFVDLLDKKPSTNELVILATSLSAMGDPTPLKRIVVAVLANSVAKQSASNKDAWIDDAFARLLARKPKQTERDIFRAALANANGPVLALQALAASVEYGFC
jgi:hypothetical protein